MPDNMHLAVDNYYLIYYFYLFNSVNLWLVYVLFLSLSNRLIKKFRKLWEIRSKLGNQAEKKLFEASQYLVQIKRHR